MGLLLYEHDGMKFLTLKNELEKLLILRYKMYEQDKSNLILSDKIERFD